MHNKTLHMVAFILLVIGRLNWLLVGLLNWGIDAVTDPISTLLTKAIYVLVGLSAIYMLLTHKASCKECEGGQGSMGM